MSGTVPVAVWAVQVPPGDELVSGVAGYDAMVSSYICGVNSATLICGAFSFVMSLLGLPSRTSPDLSIILLIAPEVPSHDGRY